MDAVDLMKCADLAAHLGQIMDVSPVWKGGYVIYDDDPVAMVLNLDSGLWKITTGYAGVLNLPQEATELMAWMGSDGTRPFPDPHNRFKVTEKETGKEISLSAKQIQRIIVDETEDE